MAKNSQKPLISFEDLRPYVKLVVKSWWLLLAFSAVGYGLGRLAAYRLIDTHKATAEILIEPTESSGLDPILGRSLSPSPMGMYNDEVQNQMRVIRSYDLVGRAIDKINDHIDFHLVGRLKETPVLKFSALHVVADMEYWAPSKTGMPIDLFVVDDQTVRVVFNSLEDQEHQYVTEVPFGTTITDQGVHLTVYLNDDGKDGSAVVAQAQGMHFRIRVKSRDQRINQYRKSLNANNVERTSIITLTCQDHLKERAKRFLDTLAATYIDYTAEARLATSIQTEQYISEQLDEINGLTENLERQVDYYRAQNEILDLTREQTEYFNTLIELEGELKELNFQAASLEELGEFLAVPGSSELSPSIYLSLDDPWLAEQIGELMSLEAKRSAMLLDVKPGSYQIRRIDSTAQHVRSNVVQYLADQSGVAERQRIDLRTEIAELESRLAALPKTQRDILAMERKLGVNEKLAVYLLERRAATIIARASITPEASLIEKARYAGQVGPDKRRIVLMYTAIGFLIALALAVARMLFFSRIESMAELREVTQAPVIGGIPFYKDMGNDPIACRADSRSAVTESFRALRTNLQYLLAKEGANVILVSSLHPQEGKSFVSANLASILAKAGKGVALVDFDMHKPKVHHYMGLENRQGASSIMIGKATIEEVVQPGAYPALDVVTAGPVPPNASDLILSDRMKSTIAKLKSSYDYVILDTPPILPISDALVLMEYVDTALLITNVSRSSRRGIQHLEDLLSQNGLKHASFILNGVKTKRWAYYYNRYAAKYGYSMYGAEYGYGYGGYHSEDEDNRA